MRQFQSLIAASLVGAFMFAGAAHGDAATEQYIAENATAVLQTLSDPTLDAAGRTEAFNKYMNEFTDLDAVASFVIGRYAQSFTEAEMTAYRAAFREYALAYYENELDRYRGESVEVVGSFDRTARDSIVNTRIPLRDGPTMDVRWRVLKRDGKYHVVDVALNVEGNLIWLAIEQRAQFLALLDRTNGSSEALIAKINEMTGNLNRRENFASTFDRVEPTGSAASN